MDFTVAGNCPFQGVKPGSGSVFCGIDGRGVCRIMKKQVQKGKGLTVLRSLDRQRRSDVLLSRKTSLQHSVNNPLSRNPPSSRIFPTNLQERPSLSGLKNPSKPSDNKPLIPDLQRLIHRSEPTHCQHDINRARKLRWWSSLQSLSFDHSCLSTAALTRPKHCWKTRRHSRPALIRSITSSRA